MIQVDLIRGRILRSMREIGIYISCLPIREQTALEALSGPTGQQTYARIADYILTELGHEPPECKKATLNQSYRKAAQFTNTFTQPEQSNTTQMPQSVEHNQTIKQKGRPKGSKNKVAAEAVN